MVDRAGLLGRLGSAAGGLAGSFGASQPFGADSPFSSSNPFGGMSTFTGGVPFGNASAFPDSQPFGQGQPFNGNQPFGGGQAFAGSQPFGGGQPFASAGPFGGGNPFATTPGPATASPDTGTDVGTGTTGAAGGDFEGPATASDNAKLTAQQIDAFVASKQPASPLKGMGAFILQQANAQGVSVPQLLGIMTLESGLGTNGALNQYYNYGGLTGSGWGGQTGNTPKGTYAREFATFATPQDGVRALIANLATAQYKGKPLRQQIGLWYLGNENAGLDANDEKGNATLAQYLNVIAGVYQGLGVGYDANGQPVSKGGTGKAMQTPSAAANRAQGVIGAVYTNGGIRNVANAGNLTAQQVLAAGVDCSSLTGWALGLSQQAGLWNAQAQYDASKRVDRSQLQAGDLLFWQGTTTGDASARPVTHVGIYLGNGKMLHAGDNGVEIVDINNSYWDAHYWGAGRF